MTWQATVTIDPNIPDPEQPGAKRSAADHRHYLFMEPQVEAVFKQVPEDYGIAAAVDGAIALALSVGRKIVITMTGHTNPAGMPPGQGISRDFVRLDAIFPEDG